MISGGLTIKELNDLLDRLASSENRYAGVYCLPNISMNVIRVTRMYRFITLLISYKLQSITLLTYLNYL